MVDDTKSIRSLLTTCLELRDYEVLTADSGKAALDIMSKEGGKIDLIFLDIRMPEMNGTEVLKSIRDNGHNCPVIIMTAFATVKNAIDCTKLGAVAYLQKPFSPERVNSVLEEIFKNETEEGISKAVSMEEKLLVEAKALIEKGCHEDAHDILKKALGINPYNKEIYFLISIVNESMNNLKEAKLFNDIANMFN